MKILIIQQKMIGDVLTSTILFEAIKEKHPNAELHYLINSHTSAVVQNNPYIDSLILFTPEIEKNNLKLWGFIKSIRSEKYDIVIDVYSKLSSNLISAFSNAKIKISYYKGYSSFIYNNKIKREKNIYTTTDRLQLLKPLGINKQNIKPKIYLTPNEILKSKIYLKRQHVNLKKTLFMISILGSAKNKTYPIDYMAKLIDVIVEETKGQILFNYIPSQISIVKNLYNCCKTETKKYIFYNVYGKDLREFLTIAKHCNALIGNEGGAINIAKAINIPTFSIFSPWINKEGWNIFEDGEKYTSIHLKDLQPKLFENKTVKEIKKNIDFYYNAFDPELIIPKLKIFLKNF
tara:strand:+ start:298 stop:1338 length:1041 start_codon:yes stop_codon:yes gene_type:complete